MIALNKRPKPPILVSKGREWTTVLMNLMRGGGKIPDHVGGKYRHEEIKISVKLETAEKCCYCESYVTHLYPGDVEHLIPKAVYPRLTFTWGNLSFVCFWCNNHKRDYVDKTCKLLNPYKDNIEVHLHAFGPMIMHINQSKRGEMTLKEIKLNRMELFERRLEALENLQNLIDKYENENVPALKSILLQELIENTMNDSEYSYTKKQYLMDRNIIKD